MSSRYAQDHSSDQEDADSEHSRVPLFSALSEIIYLIENVVRPAPSSISSDSLGKCLTFLPLLVRCAMQGGESSIEAGIAVDTLVMLLAFGRVVGDTKPLVTCDQISSRADRVSGVSPGKCDELIAEIFKKWCTLRKELGESSDTHKLTLHSCLSTLQRKIHDFIDQISDGSLCLIVVQNIDWSSDVFSLNEREVTPNKNVKSLPNRRLRSRVSRFLVDGRAEVIFCTVGVLMGVYGAIATSNEISSGYLGIPIIGTVVLVALSIFIVWSSYEQRKTSKFQTKESSANVNLGSFLCNSLIVLVKWKEKSLGTTDRCTAEVPEATLNWPALSPVDNSEIVTIKLDPAGTMVLPLSSHDHSPILVDGFHVHQHVALFGVELLSESSISQSGKSADIPRIDDSDDRRFKISMWNDAMVRITGFTSNSVMFNPFADIIADERSYQRLKQLILDMENAASNGRAFVTAKPFRIEFLTASCERTTLLVTAAPVTDSTSNFQFLKGVLFLCSVVGSSIISKWQDLYFLTALRYYHAKHPKYDGLEAIRDNLSQDFILNDFNRAELSDFTPFVTFSHIELELMKIATDRLKYYSDDRPSIFSLDSESDRQHLVVRRQDLQALLKSKLASRGIMLSQAITIRSSLPAIMEIDVSSIVDVLEVLLSNLAPSDFNVCERMNMVIGSIGRGNKGDATIAAGLRIDNGPKSVLRWFDTSESPPKDNAQYELLFPLLVRCGGFIYMSEHSGRQSLFVVLPCRSHSNAQHEVESGHLINSSDHELNFSSTNSNQTPRTILVTHSGSVNRANLIRLLSDSHHAVFPVQGPLFPQAAQILRTCGRLFDVVIADLPLDIDSETALFGMKDVFSLCLEFGSTSFILRKHKAIESGSKKVTVERGIGITGVGKSVFPANLHFVGVSHTPMSQRQLVKVVEEISLAASISIRKATAIQETLKGHVNSPWRQGARLGKGSFGEAFEAHMTLTGGVAAVKIIKVRRGDNEIDFLSGIASEINILVKLQHPNIVQYFYCEQENDDLGLRLHIFMELCKGGSLKDRIVAAEERLPRSEKVPIVLEDVDDFGGPLTLSEIISTLLQIIDALDYLHSQNIVHRDIKPGNLLLSEGRVKMADFGTAAMVSHGTMLRDTAGTFAYMAPEVYNGNQYSYPCDVWSVGCVLLDTLGTPLRKAITEGMEGATIFSGYFGDCVSTSIIHERLQTYMHHRDFLNFLSRCLCVDPGQRATAKELRQHPLLTRHVQKQDALVRNSSLMRSASMADWRRAAAAVKAEVKLSLDALSIASDEDNDAETLEIPRDLDLHAPKVAADSGCSQQIDSGYGGVAPLTIEALEEASVSGSPMQSESPAFKQTPKNVWCTSNAKSPLKNERDRFGSPLLTVASKNYSPGAAGGWNPLWGKRPLASPSHRVPVRRVVASAGQADIRSAAAETVSKNPGAHSQVAFTELAAMLSKDR